MDQQQAARFLKLKKEILEREYSSLNPEQRRAVFALDGPLLILAGAGSGKTTVLVSRIEYLIRYGNTYAVEETPSELSPEQWAALERYAKIPDPEVRASAEAILAYHPVAPWRILAITFTNKAADELKTRLEKRLGAAGSEIWAFTFHSACVRILRQEIERLGYSRTFTIYDTTDSKRVVKDCLARLGLDEKIFPVRAVLSVISRAKNNGESPEDLRAGGVADPRRRRMAQIYEEYNAALKNANALDFDDIIALTVRLFEEYPEVRAFWSRRFDHILVDEYQDTNPLQYRLVALLREKDGNLCVVGDDDQSIYRFRGATVENILLFEERFRGATVVKLERNYRSTQNILDAANAVIANNLGRKKKTLWTENGAGEKLRIVCAYDENNEADQISAAIERLHAAGAAYGECAVLYRTNAQSRAIEGSLRAHRIPARVIGGVSFYDRKEVKDVLSYLCLLVNPADNLRLRRIINEPRRGIGDQTVATLAAEAQSRGVSMLRLCAEADEVPALSRAAGKLKAFAAMMDELAAFYENNPMNLLIDELLDRTGYAAALQNDEQAEDKLQNITELSSAIVRYMQSEEEPTLFGFLERTSLLSDADQIDESDDSVSLMTLHTAKGLEFNYVFLPGMEEGLFPSGLSANEEGGIEEERRLCYVGITRAKKQLTALYTRMRLLYGTTVYPQISRFLKEIPQELCVETGARPAPVEPAAHSANRPVYTLRQAAAAAAPAKVVSVSYTVGERVRHRVFGEGTILAVTPMSNDNLLEIAFEKGTKKVMANYANLQKLS